MDNPLVVIRPFRREDHSAVQLLTMEGTLDPVNRFFVQALMRETFLQAVVMLAAMQFIIMGVPLYYTISALPIMIVLTYISIWIAHYYKAKYLHTDLNNIMKTYLGQAHTTFLVAEAYYDKSSTNWKKETPAFVTETEFENLDRTGQVSNNRSLTREIVGNVGVLRANESAVIAWIRRTAVKKDWRGKGIGSALVDRVIKFCSQKGFVGIELVTTECHDSARRLYEKKGFEVRAFYHKKYLGLSGLAIMMYAMHYKTRPYKETTINL